MVKRISKGRIVCRRSTDHCETNNAKMLELEIDKPLKLFDMGKFQHTISREMRRDKPDWGKVRQQAISSLAFVQGCPEVLDQPVWIMVINIVALDLLRSRLDSVKKVTIADDETVGKIGDKQQCKEEDPYFSGLKAKVPPFVNQDAEKHQILGHPVSWHRKVGPSPPVRNPSK
eukprot:GFUD01137550.1.p2 GENE.GFUD01137550.1~~GFUD01137550.1.p2  ORF type:complete len:184 (+),score=76.90 GFUD01137550.1:36-554(+)